MSLESALDATVARAIEEKRIVGAVLLVSRDGRMLYEKARGHADREAGPAMKPDAIFRFASLTKPIIASTILAMADRGLLRLEDAVTTYLPDFRPALPDGTRPTITIGHLLTHTSGLNTAPLVTEADIAAGLNPWLSGDDAMLERIGGRPLLFSPGASWAYGPSIDVLGVMAGRLVEGRPEDAARQFVLDPLGMRDTRFSVVDRSRLAVPYGDAPDGAVRMAEIQKVKAPWGGEITFHNGRIFEPEGFQSGGSGMAGTGQDFMKLLECLRCGGGSIMSRDAADAAFVNRLPAGLQSSGAGWGFGHIGAVLADPAMARHRASAGFTRWGGVYGHNWFVDRALRLTMVSMSNTALEGSDGAYRDEICDAVYSNLNEI